MHPGKMALPLLLVTTAMVALSLAAGAADDEPNGTFGTANAITAGDHQGSLATGQDVVDHYKFVVTAGQRIGVDFSSSSTGDFQYLTLYDPLESRTFEVRSKAQAGASDAFYTANETGTRTWYIRVRADTEGASYAFTLALTDPDDAGSMRDAGADVAGALPIAPGGELGGHLEDLDGSDHFSFTAGSGDVITVEFTGHSVDGDLFLVLYDHGGATVLDLRSRGGAKVSAEWCTANETPALGWYVRVGLEVVPGDYSFKVVVAHQDDGGSSDDAGGDFATAHHVLPGTLHGRLKDADARDYYAFWAGSGDVISVDFTSHSAEGDLALYLCDTDRIVLSTLRTKQGVTLSDVFYTANETVMGVYYLKVELEVSPGDYQAVLGVAPQDDAGLGDDAPGALADAPAIQPGVHRGHLEDADDFDTVRFQAGQGDGIMVNFSSSSGNDLIRLELLDWEEVTVLALESLGDALQEGAYHTSNETAMGWWFIRVVMDAAPGDYAFGLAVTRQDDAGRGKDAPGNILFAMQVQSGVVDGQLGGLDTVDYYSVAVRGGWEVLLNLTNEQPVSMSCGIIADTGTQLPIGAVASANGQVGRGAWTVPIKVPVGSHWYLKVVAANGFEPGRYRLELFVRGTPPDGEPPMVTFSDPTEAVEGKPLTVTATVTDNVAVLDAALYYKIDDEVTWSVLEMSHGTGDAYSATVPGNALDGQTLKFYIVARDTSYNDRSHGSIASPRQVGIAPADALPPEVTFDPPSSVVRGRSFLISVEATDNVGVEYVKAYFKIDDEVTWHVLELARAGNTFEGTIPSSSLQGSTLHYYIVAGDAAGRTGSYGTEAEPRTLRIRPKDEGPGFGAAVAVAAVATLAAALVVPLRGRRR